MFRFHHFFYLVFYLELWLRPDGTVNLSKSCCSCASRMQVPCQPGVPCKFLNQKRGSTRMLKNAHIRSMSTALMRAPGRAASIHHTSRTMWCRPVQL